MPKAYLLVGIFASGKSTWARNHVLSNTFIVCKDKIREMIYGDYEYRTSDEILVDEISKSIIKTLVSNGHNVIIDECWDVISAGARNRLSKFLKDIGVDDIKVVYFSATENNVERRMRDNHGNVPKEIWEQVKNRMLNEFEPFCEGFEIGQIVGEINIDEGKNELGDQK